MKDSYLYPRSRFLKSGLGRNTLGLLAFTAVALTARADQLGDTLQGSYQAVVNGQKIVYGSANTLAGSGPPAAFDGFDVSAGASFISITSSGSSLAGDDSVIKFNGVVVKDLTANRGITGAVLDPSSTFNVPVSFTSDSISVDLGGNGQLSFGRGAQVKVDLLFGPSVPEPGSVSLIAVGVLGLGYFARRRQRVRCPGQRG